MDADPRSVSFELVAKAASAAEARGHVRGRLRHWQVSEDLCETVQLVVSELFTNAVLHTDSDRITCRLTAEAGAIRLEVCDQGGQHSAPTLGNAGAEDERGRGLMLIDSLADAWGSIPGPLGTGRTVWATVQTSPP